MARLIPMDEWLRKNKRQPLWKKTWKGICRWCVKVFTMFVEFSAVAAAAVAVFALVGTFFP